MSASGDVNPPHRYLYIIECCLHSLHNTCYNIYKYLSCNHTSSRVQTSNMKRRSPGRAISKDDQCKGRTYPAIHFVPLCTCLTRRTRPPTIIFSRTPTGTLQILPIQRLLNHRNRTLQTPPPGRRTRHRSTQTRLTPMPSPKRDPTR
jgi:hypothetical protein